jgi:hypothetical protein
MLVAQVELCKGKTACSGKCDELAPAEAGIAS